MTKLNCNVKDCASNKDNCCCRPSIDVCGEDACCCEETCCKSYMPKDTAAQNGIFFTNSNTSLDVKCYAHNCVYNKSGKCHASSINISECASGTECSSFKAR